MKKNCEFWTIEAISQKKEKIVAAAKGKDPMHKNERRGGSQGPGPLEAISCPSRVRRRGEIELAKEGRERRKPLITEYNL